MQYLYFMVKSLVLKKILHSILFIKFKILIKQNKCKSFDRKRLHFCFLGCSENGSEIFRRWWIQSELRAAGEHRAARAKTGAAEQGPAAEAEQPDHHPEGRPRDAHHLGPHCAWLPLRSPRELKWQRWQCYGSPRCSNTQFKWITRVPASDGWKRVQVPDADRHWQVAHQTSM